METPPKRSLIIKILAAVCGVVLFTGSCALTWADGSYGSGTYGSCQYNTCGISLTSSSTVSLDITPSSGTSCTVSSDTITVLTDSSTGYTLKLADSNSANALVGNSHGGSIAASTGTVTAPSALSANIWGYRVDGLGGFGAGPTLSQSNNTIPSAPFAGVPTSTATPDTIATSSSAANPAVNTTIWFGACANTAIPGDTYVDSVVYTAVVN